MNTTPLDDVVDGTPATPPQGRNVTRRIHCMDEPRIRLLVFTSLYPNAVQPHHGVFVEGRLRQLVASGEIAATVVAPVPWFPFRHPHFGRYAAFARVPRHERRHGIDIHHPRYPVIPKLGMSLAPSLMAWALLPVLRGLQSDGCAFDLVDSHYFYPDGVAAARLGRVLDSPVVITARGSDVMRIASHRWPRRQIQWAAGHAAAIGTVSRALKDQLVAMGVDPGKITVLRNGVDLDRFKPLDRGAARARLGLAGSVWLTVGFLVESKGAHIAIEALAQVPDATLLIAGEGPDEHKLRDLVRRLDLGSRVRFLGAVPQAELCGYYNAADALIHASSREGMPNVVLEALACGTPVVAAPFDGAGEVVSTPESGQIAAARTADGIRDAWLKLCASMPQPAATRRYAERFGWAPTVRAQQALYEDVLRRWRNGGVRHGR